MDEADRLLMSSWTDVARAEVEDRTSRTKRVESRSFKWTRVICSAMAVIGDGVGGKSERHRSASSNGSERTVRRVVGESSDSLDRASSQRALGVLRKGNDGWIKASSARV